MGDAEPDEVEVFLKHGRNGTCAHDFHPLGADKGAQLHQKGCGQKVCGAGVLYQLPQRALVHGSLFHKPLAKEKRGTWMRHVCTVFEENGRKQENGRKRLIKSGVCAWK